MLPKKPKNFVKPTADKLDLSGDLVSDVIDFYWKEIRNGLTDLKSTRINVYRFGYFQLKFWALDKEKENYQKYLDDMDLEKMTFAKHKVKEDIAQRIDSINKVKVIVDKNLLKKQNVKEKKYAAKNKNNLEES